MALTKIGLKAMGATYQNGKPQKIKTHLKPSDIKKYLLQWRKILNSNNPITLLDDDEAKSEGAAFCIRFPASLDQVMRKVKISYALFYFNGNAHISIIFGGKGEDKSFSTWVECYEKVIAVLDSIKLPEIPDHLGKRNHKIK